MACIFVEMTPFIERYEAPENTSHGFSSFDMVLVIYRVANFSTDTNLFMLSM